MNILYVLQLLGAAAFGLGIWALVDKNKMIVLTRVGAQDSNFDVIGKTNLFFNFWQK